MRDNVKTIFLVDSMSDINDFQQELNKETLYVLSENFLDLTDIENKRWQAWLFKDSLLKADLNVSIINDYLSLDQLDQIEMDARQIAASWYLSEGVDASLYDGISIGECFEYKVKALIVRVMKLVRGLQSLKNRYKGVKYCSNFSSGSIEHSVFRSTLGDVKSLGCMNVRVEENKSVAINFDEALKRMLGFFMRTANMIQSCLSLFHSNKGEPKKILFVSGREGEELVNYWVEKNLSRCIAVYLFRPARPSYLLAKMFRGVGFDFSGVVEAVRVEPDFARINSIIQNIEGLAATNIQIDLHLNKQFKVDYGVFLCGLIRQDFLDTARLVRLMNGSFSADVYSLVVLPNDVSPEIRCLIQMLKRSDVPSLVLQHGYYSYLHDINHFYADYSAFWSELAASRYISRGLNPSKVFVTGWPRLHFDEIRQQKNIPFIYDETKKRVKVLICSTGSKAVHAHQNELWVIDYIHIVVCALVDKNTVFDVSLKLHPGENIDLYKQQFKEWGVTIDQIIYNGKINGLILGADVVISPSSTVIIEALELAVPVVYLPLDYKEEVVRGELSGLAGVYTVDAPDKLRETVLRAARPLNQKNDEIYGSDLSDIVGFPGQLALENLSQTVLELSRTNEVDVE